MPIEEKQMEAAIDALRTASRSVFDCTLEDLLNDLKNKKYDVNAFERVIETAWSNEDPHVVVANYASDVAVSEPGASGASTNNKSKFLYLAISICKYANSDPGLMKKLSDAGKSAKKAGQPIPSPAAINNMLIVGLAEFLVKLVPGLSGISIVVLAGILTIIVTIGMDAFCSWVSDQTNGECVDSNVLPKS
ncbi:MAG: hypothetical protein IPL73_26065 [Candidatus Obscuribacter sp.]|nr:hypothetical protein [Candidatus Obscuribacter sp.]MBK9617766.1 hypothetical protein [Candidatus Obscuribacter sp.]